MSSATPSKRVQKILDQLQVTLEQKEAVERQWQELPLHTNHGLNFEVFQKAGGFHEVCCAFHHLSYRTALEAVFQHHTDCSTHWDKSFIVRASNQDVARLAAKIYILKNIRAFRPVGVEKEMFLWKDGLVHERAPLGKHDVQPSADLDAPLSARE